MALGSFSAGLSGLNAHAVWLSVIGNNLANVNTVGFKASTVTFMDLVSQTIAGPGANPIQVGLGTVAGSITPIFSQGSIENSREPTSVAIQGTGFFVVRGPKGQGFTRAGNFGLDANGNLVTADGSFVQGYTQLDPLTGVVVPGTPGDIRIPPGVLRAPTATTQFQTLTNLNSGAAVDSTFTTSVQMFDALGGAHVVTVTYKNTGTGAWSYEMTVPGAEMAGGTAGTPLKIANGTVTFDANGKLKTVNGADPADVTITTPGAWTNGAAASKLVWDVVDASKVATLTGFATTSTTSAVSQNGSAGGSVDAISISDDGTISATLASGETIAVAQLALASFGNPKGLSKLGSNAFGQTPASGLANIGVAGTGGRGTLIGNALEQSNVDIAQEFTQMILAQRGYQANSKTIMVSDELLADTLALKR